MKLQVTILKEGFDAVFVVQYKAGRFWKLTHMRGKYSEDQHNALMKVIPNHTKKIEAYRKYWVDKIEYQEVLEDTQSLFKQMMQVYHNFYVLQTEIEPIIDGVAGKSLKQIITKLRKQAADDQEVLVLFTLIFDNWCDVPDFYANQMELRQINSNINIILNAIKNGKYDSKSKATHVSDDFRKSV